MTLVKFRAAVYSYHKNRLHVPREVELTKSEYNNFQKLRYHGLIARYREMGSPVSGVWLMTRRAAHFLRGEIDLPEKVQTFRNKVVDHSIVKINVSQALGSAPYWDQRDDFDFDIADVNDVEFDEKGQGIMF